MQVAFIVGCPRSGTTLLQVMLGRHPHILVAPETKLFYYYQQAMPATARQTLKRIEHDLEIELDQFTSARKLPPVRDVLPAVAERYRTKINKPEAGLFIEKTPEHSSRVNEILRCNPESKVIVVVRDGRDVAESLTRMPWLNCDLRAAIWFWKRTTRVLDKYRQDARFHFVSFEHLVTSPEEALRGVIQHLQLNWDSIVLDPCGDRCGVIPARELPWKGLAEQPLDITRIQRWQATMPEADIRQLEALAGSALVESGYALRFPVSFPIRN